jgi:kynurenine formamidase
VDAFLHVNEKGKPIDEMPLDMFMGKAVCFDLRHVPDLGDITDKDMAEAEKKSGVKVDGHIVLLRLPQAQLPEHGIRHQKPAAHRRGDQVAA